VKKYIAALLLLQVLAAFLTSSIPAAEKADYDSQTAFVLPAFLQTVEEDAFAGTAVQTVVFPKGFIRVLDGAFDGVGTLTDVYLPLSAGTIGKGAFPDNEVLTVHAVKGSTAQRWANAHRTHFHEEEVRMPPVLPGSSADLHRDSLGTLHRVLPPERKTGPVRDDRVISLRPQDRPELNPIDYRFP
jgi:hypothetical protein